jgi:hypothetical protein
MIWLCELRDVDLFLDSHLIVGFLELVGMPKSAVILCSQKLKLKKINMKIKSLIIVFTCFTFLLACTENANRNTSENLPTVETTQKSVKLIFDIEGEDIALRSGAGQQFDKIVNAKATEALGRTEYCQVDYTTKVKILEESEDWAKIQVVEPDWLSASHIGWIPTKNIIKIKEDKPLAVLKDSEYEIIKTRHNSTVQNFHVLVKKVGFNKDYLHEFTQSFRKKHCIMNCNVSLYDTKSIEPLIGIYPLEKKQYLEFADHLLSISTFDAAELKDWYPYQDFKYKEYGGKNWKKTPVK